MGKKRKPRYNNDGRYVNAMTKYGTQRDSDTAFSFVPEPIVADSYLSLCYEQNGLFGKIIDVPAEEAIKEGLDLSVFTDNDLKTYIEDKLEDLECDNCIEKAIKWSRLYGGAIIVMLIDDGGKLEEPVRKNRIRGIEGLRVYERAVVTPAYQYVYEIGSINASYEPEYYRVNSIHGTFVVHKSRCLIFKNGEMPELSSNEQYRYWGIPEYVRIKNDLRKTVTSHEDANKLLERSVQAVHQMKGLNSLLSTEHGEEILLKRLNAIDLARNILNTIAIDADGENYDFKTFTMTGVKDVVEVSCNMLSAITNIPQTILFGRSPDGMNSTGESDLENYYNFVKRIQTKMIKKNVRRLIDLIVLEAKRRKVIDYEPMYKIKFMPLWSLSDKEQAEVENIKAQAAKARADAAAVYINAQVLDPSEVRKALASNGEFDVETMLDNEEIEDTFEDEIDNEIENIDKNPMDLLMPKTNNTDSDADNDLKAVAVLVVKDGNVLIGKRSESGLICGPGGHIDPGESAEQAAIRETQEEFNITPINLVPVTIFDVPDPYCGPVKLFACSQWEGDPKADEDEMIGAKFIDLNEVKKEDLFYPFLKSLRELNAINSGKT